MDKAYIEAILAKQGSTEDSLKKLEEIAGTITDNLRQLTKKVQEARERQDEEVIKMAISEYDECIER